MVVSLYFFLEREIELE